MSKLAGELSYKDWCILKHGLKNSLHQKESLLFLDNLTSWEPTKLSLEKRQQLEKEVQEEKQTLQRVTKITNNFKVYINGQERHYRHRAVDCE